MTDITPKSRLEGQRGHVVHTRPWPLITDHYRERPGLEPFVRLVEAIASSPVAPQLFGATSMDDLLLSDCQDFRGGDTTLCISYRPTNHTFTFRHRSFSGRDDEKACAESEAFQTLSLFLKLKYGILFEA